MNLSGIKTFVTIVQVGSFSKAAQKLSYTQAAVTIQIKNLERELNTNLFDRVGRNIKLTGKGEQFYTYAIDIMNTLEEAIDTISSDTSISGNLSIGIVNSLCSHSFQNILKAYNKAFPEVTLSIVIDTPAVLFNKLSNNELDFLYVLDEKVSNLKFKKILEVEEQAVFTCCAHHPLSKIKNITLDTLLSYPFILTEVNASYRRVLDSTLAKKQIEIKPFMSTKNTELICEMLIDNNAVSFLPRFIINDYIKEKRLVALNVDELSIKVAKQIIHHKEKWVTREMKEFFKLISTNNI